MTPETIFEQVADARFIDELAKRVALPKSVLRQIGDQAYAIAWTIARTTDLRAMARIKQLLVKAIAEGQSLEDWLYENLPEMMELIGLGATPWYAETVFRTTLGSVFEAVRFERLTSDENVEWLVYDAINDDRVRPDHLALDGMAFPRGEFPAHLWPPNGYNCRCTVVPARADQLAELGAWTPHNGLFGLPEPDEGFNAPPSLSGLNEIAKAELLKALDFFQKQAL